MSQWKCGKKAHPHPKLSSHPRPLACLREVFEKPQSPLSLIIAFLLFPLAITWEYARHIRSAHSSPCRSPADSHLLGQLIPARSCTLTLVSSPEFRISRSIVAIWLRTGSPFGGWLTSCPNPSEGCPNPLAHGAVRCDLRAIDSAALSPHFLLHFSEFLHPHKLLLRLILHGLQFQTKLHSVF